MTNYKTLSRNELFSVLRKQSSNKRIINRERTKEYYDNFINKINRENEDDLKEKICKLIELYVSEKYIADLYNITLNEVRTIAKEYKVSANLFHKYEKQTDERCFTKGQIIKSCENYNFICPMCFEPLDIRNLDTITGHHIVPYSQGGKTTIENCLPLHIKCHYGDFEKLHGIHRSRNRIYNKKHFEKIKRLLKDDGSGIMFLINNV